MSLFLIFPQFILISETRAQSSAFTYEGRLFSSTGNPVVEPISVKFQILNPAGTCVLYEELQTGIDLSLTKGTFNLGVGSNVSDAKRSANFRGAYNPSMVSIFRNGSTLTGIPVTDCPAGSYVAGASDTRVLRVHIIKGTNTEILSPDLVINTVPSAQVAASLQGFVPSDFLRLDVANGINGHLGLTAVGTAAGQTREFRFYELAASGVDYTGFKAPDALATSLTYVLPSAAPAAGDILKATVPSSGVVTLSWGADAGAGGGISSFNGSNQSSQSFAAVDIAAAVTAPAWSTNVGTGAHTLQIPMAAGAGVTGGLITKTEHTAFSSKVDRTGDTMTGVLNFTGATGVSLAGTSGINFTGTGTIAMGTNKITGMADPSAAQEAATKAYVDSQNSGKIAGTLTATRIPYASGASTLVDSANFTYTTATGAMTIGGTAPSITSNDAITIAAGGTNKNVVLTPSGTGYTLLNGNVGIGTATPTGTLEVVGGTAAPGANGSNITITAQTGGAGNQNGGDVILSPGSAAGGGNRGSVQISNYGNLRLDGGSSLYWSGSTSYIQAGGGGSPNYIGMMAGAVGIGTTAPASKLHVAAAPIASADVGLLSLGSAPFDGATAGFFTGHASGTVVAGNAATGFAGDLMNMQVAGVQKFKVDKDGKIYGDGSTLSNVSGALSGLTAGRIPYAASATSITDSANLTWDATNFRMSVATAGQTNLVSAVEHNQGTSYSGNISSYASSQDTRAPFHSAMGISNSTSGNSFALISQAIGNSSWNGTSPTALVSGQYIPGIAFAGQTNTTAGTGMKIGAAINGFVDDTVTSGNLPTALTFRTSVTDSTGLTERMRISSAGNVGIGTTNPTEKLTVHKGTTNLYTKISDSDIVFTRASDGTNGASVSFGGSQLDISANQAILLSSNNRSALMTWNDGGTVGKVVVGSSTATATGAHLAVAGSAAIGSTYYTTAAPPADGLIVQGNVGIGTAAPATNLDISGTNATGTFRVYDQTATTGKTLAIYRDGAANTVNDYLVSFQSSNGTFQSGIRSTDGAVVASKVRALGSNTGIGILGNYTSVAGSSLVMGVNGNQSYTSGIGSTIDLTSSFNNFSPTSGTGVYNAVNIASVINQTGGANGVSRGIYINPTLTAAADFRALETVAGNVVLGTTSGNVGIATTAPASKLHVGAAPTASANYGLVSLGSAPFDGATAGFFTGHASGTILAGNAASGYAGDLLNMQVAGVQKFKVDKDGKIYGDGSTLSNLPGGGGSASGVAGSVQFSDGSTFSSAATQLFWDNTNSALGIGSNNPDGNFAKLYVYSASALQNAIYGKASTTYGVKGETAGSLAGVYGVSTGTGVGVQGGSAAGYSGYFRQTVTDGSNATPTLAARQASSQTSDLFQVQDSAGAVLARVTAAGNVGIGTTTPASKLHVGVAPATTANYGLVSLGSGFFDGATAGFFTGHANGTLLAANVAGAYAGDLINLQAAGVQKFKVDKDGKIYGDGSTLSNVSGALSGLTATRIPYATSATALGDDSALVWDATNDRLGIGVATPTDALHVKGQINMRNSSGADLFLVQDLGNDVAIKNITNATGKMRLGTYSYDDTLNLYQGKVGIGTTSPSTNLDIQATGAGAAPGAYPLLRVVNTNATQGDGASTFNQSGVKFEAGNGSVAGGIIATYQSGGTTTSGLYIRSTTNHPLRFATNNTTHMTVDTSGSVGIGTTAPSGLLEVTNGPPGTASHMSMSVQNNGTTDVYNLGISTGGPYAKTYTSTESGSRRQAMVFTDAAADTDTVFGVAVSGDSGTSWNSRFIVQQDGNVGIGTTAPGAGLEVYSASGAPQILARQYFDTNSASIAIKGSINSGTWSLVGHGDNEASVQNNFSIDYNSSPKVTVSNAGNVGVGITGPTAKLHVAGAIVSQQVVNTTNATIDASQSNSFVLTAPGTNAITITNMKPGGQYTVAITDTTARTYTFSQCAVSYFSPTNANTSNRSVYSIYFLDMSSAGGNANTCFISWISDFQ